MPFQPRPLEVAMVVEVMEILLAAAVVTAEDW
jgi:hypothetical protein